MRWHYESLPSRAAATAARLRFFADCGHGNPCRMIRGPRLAVPVDCREALRAAIAATAIPQPDRYRTSAPAIRAEHDAEVSFLTAQGFARASRQVAP